MYCTSLAQPRQESRDLSYLGGTQFPETVPPPELRFRRLVVTKASLLAELPPDHECFRRLSQLLDEEDDFCENWRALYAKCELKAGAEAKAATSSLGPTACVLKAWKQRAGPTATVGALVDFLTAIKRLDAVDAVRNALGLNKRSISGVQYKTFLQNEEPSRWCWVFYSKRYPSFFCR